jgi:16S rRNA (adenine1518-N6/adenine1519-N6)-dimethyltransferase
MAKDFIATPRRTKEILQKYQFTFKRSLGQNFMVDANILRGIISAAQINASSGVIEIGPGIGSLTEQLAIHAKKVVAFEIDGRLLPILTNTLANYHNVEIIHEDILKADVHRVIANHFSPETAIHLVANLPYYITTPIIMNILQKRIPVESMTILLQKEVAERMAAKPNTKAYGSLSIAVQYYTEAQLVQDVPKTAFMPQPNVISSVLRLERRKRPLVRVNQEEQFFNIVQVSFRHRRKNITNNLISHLRDNLSKEELNRLLYEAQIDGTRRGESLSIQEFAQLEDIFYQHDITV